MADSHPVKIQKVNCDNKNVNLNDLSQIQSQEQTLGSGGFNAGDATLNGQELTPEEALGALTGNGGGTGDPLLNIDRNIVNVCFNTNTNVITGTFTGDSNRNRY